MHKDILLEELLILNCAGNCIIVIENDERLFGIKKHLTVFFKLYYTLNSIKYSIAWKRW